MKTRTLLLSGVVAALAPTSAGAQFQLGQDASYFCVVEFAGGIGYNETTKKWEGGRFRTDRKFVLRLKFLKTRVQKDHLGKNETVHDYNVTITDSGADNYGASPCLNSRSSAEMPTMNKDAELACNTFGLYEFKFNLKTNRFIRAYLEGYISGADNNKDMPMVGGGTCTKID